VGDTIQNMDNNHEHRFANLIQEDALGNAEYACECGATYVRPVNDWEVTQ
jgi:hypothetical protein